MATTIEKPPAPQVGKGGLSPAAYNWHIVGMVVIGLAIVVLSVFIVLDQINKASVSAPEPKVKLPGYDLSAWHAQPVQNAGRYKPFETAANEILRDITSRNKWNKMDATAVVLDWMLEYHPDEEKVRSQWDDTEFILCQNKDLRKLIFTMDDDGKVDPAEQEKLTHDQVHGKFVAPLELEAFRDKYYRLKQADKGRYDDITDRLGKEINAAFHRLNQYLALRHGLYHLEFAAIPTPEAVRESGRGEVAFPYFAWTSYLPPMAKEALKEQFADPLGFVALDQVPDAAWFSIGDLQLIQKNKDQWYQVILRRVKDSPQDYIAPEAKQALREFQEALAEGRGGQSVDELAAVMERRRDAAVQKYQALIEGAKTAADAKVKKEKAEQAFELPARELYARSGEAARPTGSEVKVQEVLSQLAREKKIDDESGLEQMASLAPEFRQLLREGDEQTLAALRKLLPAPNRYDPDSLQYRMLHLSYLEARFPDLYRTAADWQQPPTEKLDEVLAAFDALGEAYRSKDAAAFAEKSQAFFATIKGVSEKTLAAIDERGEGDTDTAYPGSDTVVDRLGDLVTGASIHRPSTQLLGLELTFNDVRPFMWAWVLMLLSLLFFCLSLGLDNRLFYALGFGAYAVSLGFQLFGFFTRITISGRPPVTNLYETVIWVSFMVGVFALVLEGVYRRKVIALAGAFVATVGLVLADMTPLALNPGISPLTPVLRDNFWLTIHVLTIVSSYAGGALAWGLGNISLILIVFDKGRKETVRMLSNFIYRAMQIAVILLAIGTFLGGWWAAYSWGRFWGWDPKENGALIALVCYVIPLHMRYIGWVKDFGMAVASIVCFASIVLAWWGLNFVLPSGLHSYGFSEGGGQPWFYLGMLLNLQWVLIASLIYHAKQPTVEAGGV